MAVTRNYDTERHAAPSSGRRQLPERGRSVPRERALAVLARDAALGRIGRTRRWALIGAVVLSGLLTALASALLPGKSLGAKSRTGSSAASSSAGRSVSSQKAPPMPAPAGPSQLGLSGPSQAPAAVPPAPTQPAAPAPSSGGTVVSGSS